MPESGLTFLQSEVQTYGILINEIVAPTFFLAEYPFGDRMPHTWKVIRVGEAPEQVDIFELEPIHLHVMHAMSEGEKRQYLREMFTPYFDRLRIQSGLG